MNNHKRVFQFTKDFLDMVDKAQKQRVKNGINGKVWQIDLDFETNNKLIDLQKTIEDTCRANVPNYKYPVNLKNVLDFMQSVSLAASYWIRNNRYMLYQYFTSSYQTNFDGQYQIIYQFKQKIEWQIKITIQ